MASGNNMPREDPEKSRINRRRRQLIATVGTGVAASVAGCGGGGGNDTDTPDPGSDETDDPGTGTDTDDPGTGTDTDGTGTDTDSEGTPEMTERTFQTFHGQDLAEINWSLYDERTDWPRLVNAWVHAYKASFNQQTSEMIPMLIEDWSHDANTVEYTFRESGWSDGSGNVHPRDLGIVRQIRRWQSETRPEDLTEDNPPEGWFEGTSSIEWDDTTLRFISEDGWYDRFVMEDIIHGLLTDGDSVNLGNKISIPADPYFESIWEEAQELGNWEERKAAIDEWTQGQHLDGWSQDQEGDYVPDNPTELATSGPFTVSEISETEVILEKNEHYWNADQINWPEVRLETMVEKRQRNQAMTSNELDGINGQLYTPQATILDQLGDDWQWHRHNPDNTLGLSLNANSVSWLEDARVRQAIYLALDKEELARQGHEYANQAPPNPPGLNDSVFNQLLPDDAPLDAFDRYQQDTNRASQLMEAAGFSMQDGTWTTPEGEEASLELLADAQSPEVPALIEDQLNNFGISMSLTTNEGTVVDERKGSGDFQAGIKNWWVTHQLMWPRAVQQSDRRHRFGFVSDQEVDEFVDEYSDQGVENAESSWTNNLEGWEIDMWQDFTLPIPEIGERPIDTDPSEFRDVPVIYYGFIFENNLDREELSQWALELCWAFNWFLPYLPFSIANMLAVQHHGRWDAPTEDQPWMQHRPTNRLAQQGELQANPE